MVTYILRKDIYGAYVDRQDLALRFNTGYGLGLKINLDLHQVVVMKTIREQLIVIILFGARITIVVNSFNS